MSDPGYFCPMIFLPFDRDDWRALHAVLNDPETPRRVRRPLAAILDRVQERTGDHFGMVVWSRTDIHNAVARWTDDDADWDGEIPPDNRVISEQFVDGLMAGVDGQITDLMTVRGWDVLEEFLREHIPSP